MRVKKARWFRIGFLIFLALLVYVAFFNFERTSYSTITQASTQSLEETAKFYALTFKMKITDQLSMLESQARYFKDVDMNDYSALKKTIMSTKGMGEFKRIAIANSSGMTINYQGNTSGNIYLAEYFTKTMATGTPKISKSITVDEDGDNVLVLAVPIIQKGKANGVVTGTFSFSILRNLFSVESFHGNGYSYVVSNDGQIIVDSDSRKSLCNSNNLLNFIRDQGSLTQNEVLVIQNNMFQNKSEMISILVGNHERLCYYTPVGVNDWYVFSFVDAEYVRNMQVRISHSVYLLVIMILLAFAYMLFIFIHLQRQNLAAEKDVEKFAMANEQNRSCIFEYDLKTKKVKFTGNNEYIFGKISNPIDITEFRKLYSKIHDDDRNVMSHITDFFEDHEEQFTAEIRFMCVDGEYHWFRLNGTTMFDKDEHPAKFVGNFTNVDVQMHHELELRQIAETDSLSGLLNKGFFQKNVSKYLTMAAENPGMTGAFFIIDLDNFKQTNDTLGHAMGDIAIRDTAQKINLIFSQRDIIGRIGGDEFCVFLCLENATEEMADKIISEKAATLNENLQEYYNNEVSSVHISASIGISLYPQQGNEYSDLFRAADAALYHVKQNGKNGHAIYAENMKNGDESFYE